ncbi:MAG: dienelactone hydrolase family protein [Planctomycetaceae bacterium]
MRLPSCLVTCAFCCIFLNSTWAQETLPPADGKAAPQDFAEMWRGFDPRAEPLEIETLKEWEEDDVVLRIVRFRIGVFKGSKATLAAIYGFPKDATSRIPGLLQIHGGGQYADHKACLTNAKRGYATVSIAWAGRISAPGYRVGPNEVKLFWDQQTDNPRYKLTTDWGKLDGYHAPGRNAGNQFPSAKPAKWTLDKAESPRNSGWFLCALAARRALTFLERQPEVDPERLGVYGHSMGGKLTVMASVDPRVKAAAPSCGGISDRDNASPLFRATVGDDVSLKQLSCPIIFLSPSNDFHGRIGDLPAAVKEIKTDTWQVTCSPHHNHQDTPAYEVATQLWMDQHLKHTFEFPTTPETRLSLANQDGVPTFSVVADASRKILSVDVFYTQHGKANEVPADHEDTLTRFWHHAKPTQTNGTWTAALPLSTTDQPLWAYANITYALDEPITGAGYYYGIYSAKSFNVSSLLTMTPADELRAANVKATRKPSRIIETFTGNWEKLWFNYRAPTWAKTTHKLRDETWKAPPEVNLAIDVQSDEANTLVLKLDNHATEIKLRGGNDWQSIVLRPADFTNAEGEALESWETVRSLKLSPAEHLRPKRGSTAERKRVGKNWIGEPPKFRNLRWQSR